MVVITCKKPTQDLPSQNPSIYEERSRAPPLAEEPVTFNGCQAKKSLYFGDVATSSRLPCPHGWLYTLEHIYGQHTLFLLTLKVKT